jgi:hypothetical protein
MMETTDNRPRDEGENHDDRRLIEELESLYHQVAGLDQPNAPAAESIGDFDPGQKIQEVPSAGAISDLDPVSEILKAARRRSDHNLPCREELMERLNKIRDAYEKMLTYWPYASGDSPMAGIFKKT